MVFGDAAPRSKMDFVDGHGRLEPVFAGALREPGRVVPVVSVETCDDGAGVGAQFGAEGVGICFERKDVSVGSDDFEFIDCAFLNSGMKISQIPEEPRARMVWTRPSQRLK